MLTEKEVLERIAKIVEKTKKYKQESQEKDSTIQSLRSQIETLQKSITQELKDNSENNSWKEQYDILKSQSYGTIKHLVEDVIEPKEDEIKDLRKDIEAATEAISENKSTAETWKQRFNELMEVSKSSLATADEMKQKYEDSEKAYEILNSKFLKSEEDQKKIAQEVAEERSKTNTEREKLSKQIFELKTQNENYKKLIQQYEADIKELKNNILAEQNQAAKIKEKNSELKSQIEKLQVNAPVVGEHFETFPYRFGRTSEKVKNRFVNFVRKMYEESIQDPETGVYILRDMPIVAKEMGLSESDKDTIIKVLTNVNYNDGNKILDSDGNSKLSEEEFIDWITYIEK